MEETVEMLEKQRALVAACDYLDVQSLNSSTLRLNTQRGEVDTKSYNALINHVTARLTRQVILAKRHLDRLV